MNIEDYREYCLSLGDVEEKFPFTKFKNGEGVLVFYVCGHMFSYFDCDDFSVISLKCQPERIVELKEENDCIGDPYNESPKHWIGINPHTAPDDLLKDLTRNSYEIVKAKYTKKNKKMTLEEAIIARHSVRQYIDKPVEAEKIKQLQDLIDECNCQGNLHIQLVTDEPNAFAGGLAKYGKFSGVSNYIAMICKKGDDVNLGYYGEKVVLLAQTLGLNTCWVGLTFRKQPDKYEVRPDEKLICVLSLGYGVNQGVQHSQKKGFEEFCKDGRSTREAYPDWFVKGMKAALLAPTAINQQKFEFILHDGNKVEAKTRFTMFNSYAPIDLGIAKCHFEIGAGKDNFEWM